MAQGGREAVRSDAEVVSVAEIRELEKQVRELQRILGLCKTTAAVKAN